MCRRDHGTLARALDRDLERFLGDYVSSQQQNYDKSVFCLSLSPALLQHLVYSMYSVRHLICIKTTYMYMYKSCELRQMRLRYSIRHLLCIKITCVSMQS